MKKKFNVLVFIITLCLFFSVSNVNAEGEKYDFTINGVDFSDVSDGDVINVPSNFNLDKLNEFYVTKIVKDGNTYNYGNQKTDDNYYGIGKMEDDQGRDIIEANLTKYSNHYATLRVQSHAEDILDSDITGNMTRDKYVEYCIPKIIIKKEGLKGAMEVLTDKMPDNYSFEVWNGTELGDTTISNPGVVTAYYGSNVVNFNMVDGAISKIELVSGKGVPSNALVIDSANKKITFKSNYYNVIPLKITLRDQTVGYVNVKRIGIFIDTLPVGTKVFYHGAELPDYVLGNNFTLNSNKQRIAAVFYHESSYADYDLVTNITYEDGTSETKLATPIGNDILGRHSLKGSDYELWSGDSMLSAPKKVSVIAVKHGALSDSNTFGGATFGAGAGVEWIKG